MNRIKNVLQKRRGKTPVYIYIESEKIKLLADKDLWVDIDEEIIKELRTIIGKDSIKVC